MPAFVKLCNWHNLSSHVVLGTDSCQQLHPFLLLYLPEPFYSVVNSDGEWYIFLARRQSCAWLNLNVPVFVWVCLLHTISWLILCFSNRSKNFHAFGNRKDWEQVCLSLNLIDSFVVESLFTLFYLFMLVILLNDKNRLRILKEYSKALCMVWSQESYR